MLIRFFTGSLNLCICSCCLVNGHLKNHLLHSIHGSSCCIGGLAKPQVSIERTPTTSGKDNIPQHLSHRKGEWSLNSEAMEHTVSITHSLDRNLASVCDPVKDEIKSASKNHDNLFINQAAIAWNEMRRQWIGDQSRNSCKTTREAAISWSTSYGDLLSTSQPFAQPIPLAEMVDFLVDIWHDEGLYD
ncbi:uncharacterized protein LOC141840558 isoform X1 [Curcuma longa]|uniref:uncharacterized protein LOC141840558 isoform X1 n=2 Tax=Curcuma longa TaxID=136217 RepID=UPI003D9F6F4E